MRTTQVTLEVPFHDVDSAHIVWHGHYLKYFEIGRTALMRAANLDVEQAVAKGWAMVVGESRVRHRAPLRYGDVFHVSAGFSLVRPYLKVQFAIRRADDGTPVARGYTTLILVDPLAGTHMEVPDELVARIDAWESGGGGQPGDAR